LLPLGCAATAKTANAFRQVNRIHRFYDCCAAEREQAPSPRVLDEPSLLGQQDGSVIVDGDYSSATEGRQTRRGSLRDTFLTFQPVG
jgi:hypothetical protein